jgi:hypothetical protein
MGKFTNSLIKNTGPLSTHSGPGRPSLRSVPQRPVQSEWVHRVDGVRLQNFNLLICPLAFRGKIRPTRRQNPRLILLGLPKNRVFQRLISLPNIPLLLISQVSRVALFHYIRSSSYRWFLEPPTTCEKHKHPESHFDRSGWSVRKMNSVVACRAW